MAEVSEEHRRGARPAGAGDVAGRLSGRRVGPATPRAARVAATSTRIHGSRARRGRSWSRRPGPSRGDATRRSITNSSSTTSCVVRTSGAQSIRSASAGLARRSSRRERGNNRSVGCPSSSVARSSGANSSASPTPGATSLHSRRRRGATATSGSSPARSSGRATPTSRPGASCSRARRNEGRTAERHHVLHLSDERAGGHDPSRHRHDRRPRLQRSVPRRGPHSRATAYSAT